MGEEQKDAWSDWTLLSKASDVLAPEFTALFQEFVDEHHDKFAQDLEPGTEHSLEFTAVHNAYVALFEAKLEAFVADMRCTSADFFGEVQDCVDGKWCGLFEDDPNLWFVDILFAATEYTHFHKLMRAAAQRKQRAEGNSGGGGGGGESKHDKK